MQPTVDWTALLFAISKQCLTSTETMRFIRVGEKGGGGGGGGMEVGEEGK